MGLFGIKTKKDREHDLAMQEKELKHKEAMAQAERETIALGNARREEEQTKREQYRIDTEAREAESKRKNLENIERIKADAKNKEAKMEQETQFGLAEIEQKTQFGLAEIEQKTKLGLAEKETEGNKKQFEEQTRQTEIIAKKELEISQNEEQTRQAEIAAKKELEIRRNEERTRQTEITAKKELEISQNEERTRQAEIAAKKELEISQNEARTKQTEIEAQKQKALAEKNKQIQIKAIETTKEMFLGYMQFISESQKSEIEFLIHQSETRKAKFLTSIAEAGKRKEYLLELSKDVKGQEKINYLNEAHDIEESIKEMQRSDKEADMDLAAKLTMLSDSRKKEQENGQEKLMNVNSLFLNYKGDIEQ